MLRGTMLICLLPFLFSSGLVQAAVIYVPDNQPSIQDAINASTDGDTILVRAGTWMENIDFVGKAISVKSCYGPEITGINGRSRGRVVAFTSGEGPDSIIDGFTLFNGKAVNGAGIQCSGGSSPTITGNVIVSNWAFSHSDGGGIHCSDSSPLISGNIIKENSAGDNGGGIACVELSSPVIIDNLITQNTTGYDGGGIFCEDSSPVIRGNTISKNQPNFGGGGICCGKSSSATVDGNVIFQNTAWKGGGIDVWFCSPVISNNMIFENSADLGGGINCEYDCYPVITNCTITRNGANQGGGIKCYVNAYATVANSIVWSNQAPQGTEIWIGGLWGNISSIDISNSDIQGGQGGVYMQSGSILNWGQEMIDADPLFANPGINDFHILLTSPCRNSGDNAAPGLPAGDFEGDPRIHDGTVDMGADEHHPHLYAMGKVELGGTISICVIGPPAERVILGLGTGVMDSPIPTPYGDLYLQGPTQSFPLGLIQADGLLAVSAAVPATWALGEEHPCQALIGAFGNPASFLTNLMVLTVEP